MEPGKKKNCGPQREFIVDGVELTHCHMRVISLALFGMMRKHMETVLEVEKPTIDGHFNRVYRVVWSKLNMRPGLNENQMVALIKWAMKHGFDEKGCFMGEFLFEGVEGHPFWESDQPPATSE